MKLRVPEIPTYIEAWKILGTNPTPITYNEMFLALKQNIVEAQENPLEVIYTNSLYEVQKYVIETKHLYSAYLLMVNDKMFNSLSDQRKLAIQQAAQEAADYEFELIKQYEQDYILKLKAEGMTFVTLDDINAFKKAVIDNLPKKFKGKWEPGLFEKIQSIR
jgi:TRAP-type C4-dicarboxylate transport system substrate-binding protein